MVNKENIKTPTLTPGKVAICVLRAGVTVGIDLVGLFCSSMEISFDH